MKPLTPTAPGTPTLVKSSLVASGGLGATVTWTAPVSAGSSPITGYTVTSAPGLLTCNTTSTTCDVLGLSATTSYTFTVKATNAVGSSAASAASTAVVTPSKEPGAPTGVIGTPLALRVQVRWTAPTYAGQPAQVGQTALITGYTVTASPGGATCTTAGTQCEVTGLTGGTNYTFTVKATNSYGSGPASAASIAVKPSTATVPSAPQVWQTTALDEAVNVYPAPPSSDGGSPITGYKVTASPGGATCSIGNGGFCEVTGLTAGVSYTFTIQAINAVGLSAASAPSASVKPLAPAALAKPTNVSFGPPGLVVWEPGSGGGVVSHYTVTASPGGATCETERDETECMFDTSMWTKGISYTFTVTATNGAGTSPASDPSAPFFLIGPPGKPTNVTAKYVAADTGYATVTFSWSAPVSTGGSPITSYVLSATLPALSCRTVPPVTSCTGPGKVALGASFILSIAAGNQYGSSGYLNLKFTVPLSLSS